MKLKTFIFFIALSIFSTTVNGTPSQVTEVTPVQCAERALEMLDIGYERSIRSLEYNKYLNLYRAAQSQLEYNSLKVLYSDDPDQTSKELSTENAGLQNSMGELSRKIMGAESIINVLTNEFNRLEENYNAASCITIEKALDLVPSVCEKIGNTRKTCNFLDNVVKKPPAL